MAHGRWRYIDPAGVTQGPFPAKHMLNWYRKGMLHDMHLPTCGAVRSRSRMQSCIECTRGAEGHLTCWGHNAWCPLSNCCPG